MATLDRVLRAAQNAERNEVLTSLWDFAKSPAAANPFLREQPNGSMCRFFEDALPPKPEDMGAATQKLSMLLGPRNSFKSTIGVTYLCEYFALKWKLHYGYDVRIGIGRSSRELAGNALKDVRQGFETNSTLRSLLGIENVKKSRWTNLEVRLGWRQKSIREATLATMGLDHAKTGEHYDLIVLDDLITEVNYESSRTLEYARTYIDACLPLLETWGALVYIGTRWAHNDPPGKILREEQERVDEGRPTQWNISVNSCYLPDGELYFPDRLSAKFLNEQRERCTPKMFAAWYLNKVTSDSDVVFKPEDIRYFDGEYEHVYGEPPVLKVEEGLVSQGTELRVKPLLLCDTATTTGARSDHSGLILLLGDQWGRWWIWDAVKVRELPSTLMARVARMARTYEPHMVSVETVAANNMFAIWLEQLFREESITIQVYHYNPQTEAARMRLEGGRVTSAVSKSNRIEYLEPYFAQGKIFVRKGLTSLINEILTYDGVRKHSHYDLLDALAQASTLDTTPITAEFIEQDGDAKERAWRDGVRALAGAGDEEAERLVSSGRWTGR